MLNYEKYLKYKVQYIPNEIYWGLGIENEVYLEFQKKRLISKYMFINNHDRERYSIDYFENYNKECIDNAFLYLDKKNTDPIKLPLLLNSHSFTFIDKNNQHKTLYSKNSHVNPDFDGIILLDVLSNDNVYFKQQNTNNWLFDGDTIEFVNNNFYKTTLLTVINELNEIKTEFINNLNNSMNKNNIFQEYGNLKIMDKNYPFAIHLSNYSNISMFNNGTLHYNITLPTILDNNSEIKDFDKFKFDHNKAIKIIQWFEPFLIAIYGASDYFSLQEDYDNNTKFSKSSQRCAISRYIGIGTYDTNLMDNGKILTRNIHELNFSSNTYWWFNKYYEDNAYNKLTNIGMDINFNKHLNHGIEIRFFEHLKDEYIYESFEFIIYLIDYILESDYINEFENPIYNELWNNIVLQIMKKGHDYILSDYEKTLYEKIMNIRLKNISIYNIYNEIFDNLKLKYNTIEHKNKYTITKKSGLFSSLVLSDIIKIDYKKEEKMCCIIL
jgi:hypothetical protein